MSRRVRNIAAPDIPADVVVSDPVSAAAAIATNPQSAQVWPRSGSKLAIVLGLLEAPQGASLTRLIVVTGWLPHTTRAALTGLRKRGFTVSREKANGTDTAESVYRVSSAEVA
ncbi:DUF3489 domain-containing protein [Bosea sp. Leaf344]|uniref:DUF3489 domain-containing protein n=1 Tax=Bosea sp. Leaf344 TaxID=1736346 RepID=UPI0009EC8449|nr:DUF3489 domain-containing protein [Bosea sp. Leaf344]